MKYLGNKTRLLEFIKESMQIEGINIDDKKVLDLFAGTGSVSLMFKEHNCDVTSIDFMNYSIANMYEFNYFNVIPNFEEIKDIVGGNNLGNLLDWLMNFKNSNCSNYYFDNYCPSGLKGRQYFSDKNGAIIDNVMTNMRKIKDKLPLDKYMFVMGIVMNSFDRVSNIAGTYGTYLKIWRSMALKDIEFKIPELVNRGSNVIIRDDVTHYMCNCNESYDIVYIDPPYNQRQYAPNFHVLENLVNNDKPELIGKAGLIKYTTQLSDFCKTREALPAFENLIKKINSKYIVMSYSTEGIMKIDDLLDLFGKIGKTTIHYHDYRRFKTNKWTEGNTGLKEVLIICKTGI